MVQKLPILNVMGGHFNLHTSSHMRKYMLGSHIEHFLLLELLTDVYSCNYKAFRGVIGHNLRTTRKISKKPFVMYFTIYFYFRFLWHLELTWLTFVVLNCC